MSVVQHEAVCFDSLKDRMFFFDDFEGDSLKDLWTKNGAGSAVVLDGEAGGVVRISTVATNGNSLVLDWNDIRTLFASKNVVIEARFKLNDITNLATSGLYIYYDGNERIQFLTSSATGTWRVRTEAGGVGTSNDTGILYDTGWHTFRIVCTATEIKYFLDDVEVTGSPITTNIPSVALQIYFVVSTSANEVKSMDIDYIGVSQLR